MYKKTINQSKLILTAKINKISLPSQENDTKKRFLLKTAITEW